MKRIIADHRAVLGLIGTAALAGLSGSLALFPGYTLLDLVLLLVTAGGLAALTGSPYWRILHGESPLRRAVTGQTRLDERELALRDRASGLTYSMFTVVNLLIIFAMALLIERGMATVDASLLYHAFVPYSWFALSLPVIVLEWFEPSGLAAAEDEPA